MNKKINILGLILIGTQLSFGEAIGMGGNTNKALPSKTFNKILKASEPNEEGLVIISEEKLFEILHEQDSLSPDTFKGGNTNGTHLKEEDNEQDTLRGNSN